MADVAARKRDPHSEFPPSLSTPACRRKVMGQAWANSPIADWRRRWIKRVRYAVPPQGRIPTTWTAIYFLNQDRNARRVIGLTNIRMDQQGFWLETKNSERGMEQPESSIKSFWMMFLRLKRI